MGWILLILLILSFVAMFISIFRSDNIIKKYENINDKEMHLEIRKSNKRLLIIISISVILTILLIIIDKI